MSQDTSRIICRRCNEAIPTEPEQCPHCGATIRGTTKPMIAVVIGVGLVLSSLLDLGALWFFGLLGLVIALGAGYLLYDRRRRIRKAAATGGGISRTDAE